VSRAVSAERGVSGGANSGPSLTVTVDIEPTFGGRLPVADSQPNPSMRPTFASWAALTVAVTAAVGVGLVPLDRQHYFSALHALKVELPTTTMWMLRVPGAAFVAAGVALGGSAAVAQWFRRRRGGATAFHLAIALAAVLIVATYREAVLAAYLELERALLNLTG
jgi:hypothetical protein